MQILTRGMTIELSSIKLEIDPQRNDVMLLILVNILDLVQKFKQRTTITLRITYGSCVIKKRNKITSMWIY